MEENDKYKSDRYNRELYIPKGFILPDGTMLTKKYARLHDDMAEKFVHENYHSTFKNDVITDPKDFMILRLKALQVLSLGKPRIIYSEDNDSEFIFQAVQSYLSYGWKQTVVANPYRSYFEYLRYLALPSEYLIQNTNFEK